MRHPTFSRRLFTHRDLPHQHQKAPQQLVNIKSYDKNTFEDTFDSNDDPRDANHSIEIRIRWTPSPMCCNPTACCSVVGSLWASNHGAFRYSRSRLGHSSSPITVCKLIVMVALEPWRRKLEVKAANINSLYLHFGCCISLLRSSRDSSPNDEPSKDDVETSNNDLRKHLMPYRRRSDAYNKYQQKPRWISCSMSAMTAALPDRLGTRTDRGLTFITIENIRNNRPLPSWEAQ